MAAPLILFGIPTFGVASTRWMAAVRQLQMPLGCSTTDIWLDDPGLPIDAKRNIIAKKALEIGANYVLYIGDDTILPSHAVLKLLQTAGQGRQVVSALYTSRSTPPQPMIWRGYLQGSYYDWHVGEVFKVDWAGADALLVNTDVFRQVPEPWFNCDYVFEGDQPIASPMNTEDIHFFEKLRSYGIQAWCDASVICIHKDRHSGYEFTVPFDWPQMIPGSDIPRECSCSKAGYKTPQPDGPRHADWCKQDYLIADIGSGMDSWYVPEGARLVRFDIDERVQPDVRCDIRSIPEPDEKYDEIWARHVLEHFSPQEAPVLLREWCRLLKIGGKVRINVPNFELAIGNVLKGPPHVTPYNWWQIYGRQATEWDIHRNGFTQRSLAQLAEMAWTATRGISSTVHGRNAAGAIIEASSCLEDIQVVEQGNTTENIELTARKVLHPTPVVIGPRGEFSQLDEERS